MNRFIACLAAVCACPATFAALAAGQPVAPAAPPRESIPVTRLSTHPHAFAEYSGVSDSTETVVRDSVVWRALWERVTAPIFPKPRLPDVDFRREMIVVAAMGRRPSGGYDIVIDSAAESANGIEVVVRRTIPGERCLTSAAVTQPIDLARIPARPKPVRFRELEQSVPCGGRAP